MVEAAGIEPASSSLEVLTPQRLVNNEISPADSLPTQDVIGVLFREWNKLSPEVQIAISTLLDAIQKQNRNQHLVENE